MTETEELNALYEAALKAGKCHNKGQFADLVRKDRTGISSAMNGKRMSDNLMTDVRERLAAQGITISGDTDVQPQSKTNSPTLEKCLDIIISQQEELRKQNEAQREMQDRLLSLLENKKGLQNTHASAV